MNALKSLALACAVAATATPAAADQTGAPGPLLGVTVNEMAADKYAWYRGTVVVLDTATMTNQVYRWGGTICSGKNLTENSVQVLSRAVGNRSVYVAPSWKPGLGGNRCIVGYIFAEPDAIDVIQQ